MARIQRDADLTDLCGINGTRIYTDLFGINGTGIYTDFPRFQNETRVRVR